MQIFIDLDGPILDVARRFYLVYSDLLKQADYLPFDSQSYWSLKRLSIKEGAIVQRNMPESGVPDYLQQRGRLLEDPAYLLFDRLQAGASDVLARWAGEHRVYLVTLRHNRKALLSQLKLLGIDGRFDEVFCAQDSEWTWQTKCEWIRAICGPKHDAVIIGATEMDVLAGHAAGIHTVAVTCGMRSRRFLEQLSPEKIVSNIADCQLEEFLIQPDTLSIAESVA
jgi:phosphoglycolate phosphatase